MLVLLAIDVLDLFRLVGRIHHVRLLFVKVSSSTSDPHSRFNITPTSLLSSSLPQVI